MTFLVGIDIPRKLEGPQKNPPSPGRNSRTGEQEAPRKTSVRQLLLCPATLRCPGGEGSAWSPVGTSSGSELATRLSTNLHPCMYADNMVGGFPIFLRIKNLPSAATAGLIIYLYRSDIPFILLGFLWVMFSASSTLRARGGRLLVEKIIEMCRKSHRWLILYKYI